MIMMMLMMMKMIIMMITIMIVLLENEYTTFIIIANYTAIRDGLASDRSHANLISSPSSSSPS